MIGPRVGLRTGMKVGIAGGIAVDDLGGGFFGQTNPNNGVLIFLQSNAGGKGVAASMTDFPAVTSSYANVKLTRHQSNAGDPPTWTDEGPLDLQPRTVNMPGGVYVIGTCGVECELGRWLDTNVAGTSGKWRIMQVFIDGSGIEDQWDNPAFPSTGTVLMTQLLSEIRTRLTAMNAHLELIVPIGGEHDSSQSPDFQDWKSHLNNVLINRLRGTFGPAKIVIPCLSWYSTAGGSVPNIITGTQEFCIEQTGAAQVNTSLISFRDGVHYADDAAGVKGYCTLGDRIGAAYNNIGVAVANPVVTAVATPAIASSVQNLGPLYVPTHKVNDVHLLILSALGNTDYATPSGWTQLTNSPQHNGGNSLNARLQVWWRRAVDSNTPQPTIADIGGDDSKVGTIINLRGCNPSGNPFDVSAGATAVTSTSVSFPTITTTVANTLVLSICAIRVDLGTPQFSAWANVDLTSIEVVVDYESTTGAGFGFGVMSGVKAAAGAVSAGTATLANTSDQALITVAFKP